MNSPAHSGLLKYQILIRLAAPVLAAGLLVAACGSGSSTASGGTSTPAASGQTAFLKCLRGKGVTLPAGIPTFASGQTPGSGQLPAGTGQGKAAKAFQACRKLAPSGFRTGGASGNSSAIAAFASCMKDHGVKLTGTGFSTITALSHHGGKAGKAFKTCQTLLPQGLPH